MPYVMEIDGMAALSETLEKLEKDAPRVASMALYQGAKVMSGEVMAEISRIKTEPFHYAKGGETRLPSPEEKEILMTRGVGVAPFDKNGFEVDTSVGLDTDGYVPVEWNHMHVKARTNYKLINGENVTSSKASLLKMGKGTNEKPLAVIGNAINSGTSFMKKQPFVRNAAKNGGPKAMKVMQDFIEAEFDKTTKETGGNNT